MSIHLDPGPAALVRTLDSRGASGARVRRIGCSMNPIRLTLALLAGLVLAPPAVPDTVVLVSGDRRKGGVHRDDLSGVGVNPYNSRHPEMVFDVKTYPRDKVKEVILDEPLFGRFLKRAGELAGAEPGAWVELAEWCDERDLREERDFALIEALRRDPGHEEALKAFGRSKFPRAARGNPKLDPEVRAAVDEYLELRDPEERGKAYGRLKRQRSVKLPQEYFDRILRSRDQPKGLTRDRALTLRSTEGAGVYTIFVPEGYDPRRPWPLVLGLHGGGVGGKEGDAVVGSGSSAMNFYVRQATARGYLVVCPSALAAPWAASRNEPLGSSSPSWRRCSCSTTST